MSSAPIALFVYNRPDHTRRTIAALAACPEARASELVVYSDAPRSPATGAKVQETREVAAAAQGFASVRIEARTENLGAFKNITLGVGEMLERHGRAIFMEDDLVCSPHALAYLNECLERYANQPNVMAACAYSYPRHLLRVPESYEYDAYFTHGYFPWGWASWKRVLRFVDWQVQDYETFRSSPTLQRAFRHVGEDLEELLARQQAGELDDWVLPFMMSAFRNNFVSICPTRSLIDNIGHDGSGLHCPQTQLFANDLAGIQPVLRFPQMVFIDGQIHDAARRANAQSLLARAYRRVLDLRLRLIAR